jgi:hypothetical protein
MARRPNDPYYGAIQIGGKPVLKNATVSKFDGGWDIIDTDLNITPKYAKRLRNMFRAVDGEIQLRWGTRQFAWLQVAADIVALTYYQAYLIAVDANGIVWAVDGTGTYQSIWNPAAAAMLRGAPPGWSPTHACTFTEFSGQLLISNGIDKPIIVFQNLRVEYLGDIRSNSNVNTPIGDVMFSLDKFVMIANGSILNISNQATSGTWYGDTAPNNAVKIDMSLYVNGDATITGMGAFRGQLVVCFNRFILVGQLGIFDSSGAHTPDFSDPIENYGCVGPNGIQFLGDDLLIPDQSGIITVERVYLTTILHPKRVSTLIDPAIRQAFTRLDTTTLKYDTFSVWDRGNKQYMYFVPMDSTKYGQNIERQVFMYQYIPERQVAAWNEVRGWRFRCGTRSTGDRVFFAQENRIFIYGSNEDPIYADLCGWQEEFSDGTVFTDGTGWTPVADPNNGLSIDFDWVMPWQAYGDRMRTKKTKYLQLDTSGTAQFTVEWYVNNFYQDRKWLGDAFTDGTLFTDSTGFTSEDPPTTPYLSMDFIGGDALGFGGQGFGQAFGGGRLSSEERLYKWPSSFKLGRLRVQGRAKEPLSFTSYSLAIQGGTIRT